MAPLFFIDLYIYILIKEKEVERNVWSHAFLFGLCRGECISDIEFYQRREEKVMKEGGAIVANSRTLMEEILRDIIDIQNYIDTSHDELEMLVRRLKTDVLNRETRLVLRLEELKDKLSAAMRGED
jgi:hypothetical protein